jgi:hypothetical protein
MQDETQSGIVHPVEYSVAAVEYRRTTTNRGIDMDTTSAPSKPPTSRRDQGR